MTTLLLDASVLLAAADPKGNHHGPSRAILEDDKIAVATLDLARYEVVNVAVRGWRAPALAGPLLAVIDRLADDGGVVTSAGSLLSDAAVLAEAHGISVYDAAYAAAAQTAGLELVSCDERDLVSKGLASLPANVG
ncbi:MAG TPA: type II toxin-antitoxin system VapC family toxin [Solirubrobacterales bacterium]|nr:type II toxin-antitoxin system VapC family toxin [Solirubrobacterales bacterium]